MTHLGGFPGLPGRVTRSAEVTIYHVNVSRWGNPRWVAFIAKSSKAKQACFKNFGHFLAVSWQKSPETAKDTQGV